MQAVAFSTFGGPEVLSVAERPDPQPGPGEVVVDVAAASINPTDILMRTGAQAASMTDLVPPYVAGMEFSGHVAAVGQGVSLPLGAPVIGVVQARRPAGGAQQEKVCVPAASVAVLDPGIDLVAATAVPMNALTAMMALDLLGLAAGQTVLVTGGAGIMGGFTICLAHEAGLKVLANGAEADHALLRELGADVVLPRDAGLEEALRAACPAGVDGLVDAALIGRGISHLVRDGGGAVTLRGSHQIADGRLKTHVVMVPKGMLDTDKITRIARLMKEGVLVPRIAEGGVFPFTEAQDAYRMAERGGFRGRVVLTF